LVFDYIQIRQISLAPHSKHPRLTYEHAIIDSDGCPHKNPEDQDIYLILEKFRIDVLCADRKPVMGAAEVEGICSIGLLPVLAKNDR
jgi:hypothetical protein